MEASPYNSSSTTVSHHSHADHPTNYTVVTTVRIRVTPLHDHYISWGILILGFFIACLVASWQVVRENRILKSPSSRNNDDDREVPLYSSADVTRSLFRRILLVAMVTRLLFIPIQIWAYDMFWQFLGDSFPEMVFATAWSLLVTFFVQLVGVATGNGGSNASPGMVTQAIAWVVYSILMIVEPFNSVASVLLYALLGGIYATLLGFVLYFLPRLLFLMHPQQNELSIRLVVCTLTCCAVFGGHAVGYGRMVVAPPLKVYWWIQYGFLELFPAIVFLSIMQPSVGGRNTSDDTPESRDYRQQQTIRRVDSGSSRRLDSSNTRRAPADGRGGYGTIEYAASSND